MKDNNASRTAEIVAAMRAKHAMYDNPVVFDDPFAIDFCNDRWQAMLRAGEFSWKVMDRLGRGFKPISLEVIGRARYTEDLLELAMDKGVEQYIILGAGFDSFCLRRPDLQDKLRVFEVDFVATQESKRRQLIENYGALPTNLNFVDVNFEQETLADGLKRSDFEADKLAFISWLGTTMYLSRSAMSTTLQSIASYTASGTELVFDYYTAPRFVTAAFRRPLAQRLAASVARQGEPFIGFYQANEMEEFLSSSGLNLLENFTPAQQNQRYFNDRVDSVKTFKRGYFAHCMVG